MLLIILSSYTWGKTYYVAPTGGVILFWELLHNPGQHGRRHSILQMLEIQFFSEVGSGIPLQGLITSQEEERDTTGHITI